MNKFLPRRGRNPEPPPKDYPDSPISAPSDTFEDAPLPSETMFSLGRSPTGTASLGGHTFVSPPTSDHGGGNGMSPSTERSGPGAHNFYGHKSRGSSSNNTTTVVDPPTSFYTQPQPPMAPLSSNPFGPTAPPPPSVKPSPSKIVREGKRDKFKLPFVGKVGEAEHQQVTDELERMKRSQADLKQQRHNLESALENARGIWQDMIDDAVDTQIKRDVQRSLQSPEAFIANIGTYMQLWANSATFDPNDGTGKTIIEERAAAKEQQIRIKELEKREQELMEEVDRMREVSETQNDQHARAFREVREQARLEKEDWLRDKKQMQLSVREKEDAIRSELEARKEEHEMDRDAQVQSLIRDMDGFKAEASRRHAAMIAKHKEEFKSWEHNLNNEKSRHASHVQNIASEHADALEKMEIKYKIDIAEIQSRHDERMAQLEDTHHFTIGRDRSEAEQSYKALERKCKSLEAAMLRKMRWQPISELTFKSQFDALHTRIASLAKSSMRVPRGELGPIFNQSSFIQSVRMDKDAKLVIEQAIWNILWRGFFSTPFQVFGPYGDELHLKWCELFSRSNPDGSIPHTPDPIETAENWRVATVECLKQALDSNVGGEMASELQRSFRANREEVMETLRRTLSKVGNDLTDDERQLLNEILSKASKLAVDMGTQRCRMQLFGVTPNNDAAALPPDCIRDRNGRNGPGNTTGIVTLSISPGLQRIGDERGWELDKGPSAICPADVFLAQS